ncbi:MAG: class I SAM-dependent methyltransferase [Hymenobacter sp.]
MAPVLTPTQHWEAVYAAKQPHELGWFQAEPTASLTLIRDLALPRQAAIIDIGGGDSRLVDFLLAEGYEDVTVLDLSGTALARARQRLGAQADRVQWLEADVRTFVPTRPYALWHDRAAFHFLTTAPEVAQYLQVARGALAPGAYLALGTFSTRGPARCSGLPVQQYSADTLTAQLREGFRNLRCRSEDHLTPSHTPQNFLFCTFQRQPAESAA